MKTQLMALLGLCLSFSVAADTARIGDMATLVGTYNGQQLMLKSEITKYNSREAKYTIKNTMTVPGQGTFSEEVLATEDEIMTPEKGELILVMCSQMGGVIEPVKLSMGTFNACKISAQAAFDSGLLDVAGYTLGEDQILNGALWLGKFPIQGVARMLTHEQSLTLESFRWGK